MGVKYCSVKDCCNFQVAKTLCDKHWQRLRKNGSPDLTTRNMGEGKSLQEKFWSKVAVTANPDKCWFWKGSVNRSGYGHATGIIGEKKSRRAHRIAYFYYFGVDPADLAVCHKCDQPGCCNPHHLFLGTQQENLRDMTAKGRDKRGRAGVITK